MKKIFLIFISMICGYLSPTHAQDISIRTNLVGLSTLNLNVEPSISIGNKKRWSLHLPIQYNPFVLDGNKKMQNLTVMPGVRYWFLESYVKNYVGTYVVATNYHGGNIFGDKYRYYGNAYGLGISYGFAKPIAKRWNIELEGGVGAIWADYEKYTCKKCGKKVGDYNGWYILPTKLSASIVYLF